MRRRTTAARAGLAASLLYMCALVAGCTPEPAIRISEARAPATPPGASVGAAYLTIQVHEPDTLLGASTPVAQSVEIHQTAIEEGIARMRKLENVPLEAREPARFEPGGTHFMLLGLAAPLAEGESFPLTLRFERAGELQVQTSVVAPDAAHAHH